jgi:hypothetical protein
MNNNYLIIVSLFIIFTIINGKSNINIDDKVNLKKIHVRDSTSFSKDKIFNKMYSEKEINRLNHNKNINKHKISTNSMKKAFKRIKNFNFGSLKSGGVENISRAFGEYLTSKGVATALKNEIIGMAASHIPKETIVAHVQTHFSDISKGTANDIVIAATSG